MKDSVKTFIIKNDDSSAFGNCLFRILQPAVPQGTSISRIAVQIGPITKIYNLPTFPINVQLSREESSKLDHENPINVLIYDSDGNPQTAIMKNKYVVLAGETKVFDYGRDS